MSNLGKWGALSGLGMGISQIGEAKRQEWILSAQQAQENAREEKREQRQDARDDKQHARSLELEGERHKNNLERDAEKPRNDPARVRTWTNGDVSYMLDESGQTLALGPGETQWRKVAGPGEDGGAPRMSDADLRAQAEEYAKTRVNEMAGWTSTDGSDFKDFGGSREQARQHFISEYIQSGGNLSTPDPGADLDNPPAATAAPATPAAQSQPQQPARQPMSGQVIRDPELSDLDPELLNVYQQAKAAIDANPANREEVIRRLRAAGIDDATIQKFKF